MTKANDFVRWTTPSNDLPVAYKPFRLQPEKGTSSMQDTLMTKRLGLKIVGSKQPTQNVMLAPGTTTRDLLKKLGLDGGYEISGADNPVPFRSDEVIFARVRDGDLLHVSAMVDAGS